MTCSINKKNMWEPEERLQQEYIGAERERDYANEDLRDWS